MSVSSYDFGTKVKDGLTSIGEGLKAIARAIETKGQPVHNTYNVYVTTTAETTAQDVANTIKAAMEND